MGFELALLYEDEAILAINKASGLLVHRGWGNDPVVAADLVREYLGRPAHTVHRIDRGTSGVLLFATSPKAARALSEAFANQAVSKEYIALVRGHTPDRGLIDHAISRQKGGPPVAAQTQFERIWTWTAKDAQSATLNLRSSLVFARPKHGRLHQIRRHFKHLSHPLIGDTLYGKGAQNRYYRQRFNFRRLALHANKIKFIHPLRGEHLEIRAPLPEDFCDALRRMGIEEQTLRVL